MAVIREYQANSPQEAMKICYELKANGLADFFRGQKNDYPTLGPSIFRGNEPANNMTDTLEQFLEWSSSVPQMSIYEGNTKTLTAIAQHYGVPTPYLDLTRKPEVAMLFAKHQSLSSLGENRSSVIYCFSRKTLEAIPNGELIEPYVENLWRLEAQEGLFLNYLDLDLQDTIKGEIITILFPSEVITPNENIYIYPSRKSSLETTIDQWIYRNGVSSLLSQLEENIPIVRKIRRQTHKGVFRWRKAPELGIDWVDGEPQWAFPQIESVTSVNFQRILVIPRVSFEDPHVAFGALHSFVNGQVEASLKAFELLRFDFTEYDFNPIHKNSLGLLMERVWDGIRVLPFTTKESTQSIAFTLTLLIARTLNIEGRHDWPQSLLKGETELLEVAPVGGHIDAGLVSKRSLANAFGSNYLSEFTEYRRQKFQLNPQSIMQFVTDHWMIFDFKRFKKMYIEEFVPTSVDMFWDSMLTNYDGELEGYWSTTFNPFLLAYVSDLDFKFLSPIAIQHDCEQIIFIEKDMTRADLEEIFVSCWASILTNEKPFVLQVHGFANDSREIWNIPEVIKQMKHIVKIGGISVLECFRSMKPTPEEAGKVVENDKSIGALEVWLIANGRLNEVNGKNLNDIEGLIDEFHLDYLGGNTKIQKIAETYEDWPHARAVRLGLREGIESALSIE